MAHILQMHVIAEGVETEAQLKFLRGKGCDQIQGYYFMRPVPQKNSPYATYGKRLELELDHYGGANISARQSLIAVF